MSTRQPFEREKQSKSPDEDMNKSFIKKVKSKMSSLITSPLTKWFGSPNSSNANGSASVESSNSSTEDEALEAQLTQTPSDTRFTLTETKSTSTNTESTETFSMVKSTTVRSSFRPETNFVSTPLHSPKEEIIPKPNTSEYKLQNSSSIGGNSIIRKRKSLFDLRNEEEKPAKKKPALNSSRTSEPYFNRTLVGSPFYAGPTRYGGAACPNVPNIKHINTTLVGKSENNDSMNISQTTRRIMELLENYSSPLIEARRISQTRYVRTPNSSVVSPTNRAHKTQELYVPSMAKLLQLKQKSKLMATTSTARQLIASHSSSLDFRPYPTPKTQCSNANEKSEKLNTKMKGYITRSNLNDKKVSETDELAPVHLPTAVLQIDENNLPKFTLGTSVKETLSDKIISEDGTTSTTSTTVYTMSAPKFLEQDHDQIQNNEEVTSESQANIFCFSNPVMINVGTVENCSPVPNYIFGSPERQSMEQSKDKKNYTEVQTQKWKCEDCWVSNESHVDKCVCCGAGKSVSKEKHSSACKVASSQECLDKYIDCINKTDKVDGSVTKPTITSKWKCELCWVQNDGGVDKCVCCGGERAQEMRPDTNAKSWLCPVCLIKNKTSADKCLACSEAKPSTENKTKDHSSQPNIGIQASKDSTFKNMMKSQCDKWECPTCLVHNERNKSKCACCDAEKPGIRDESKEKSFNFSNIQSTTFKFGIDPKQNIAEKKTKSTSVPQLETPVKHSETNYGIASKPPTFTFGIPNQNSDKIMSDTETIAEETSKQSFIFGESKSIVSSAPAAGTLFSCPLDTGSKLTESTLKSSIETDENIPQVPNIEEPNTAVPKNHQKPIGLFGSPLNTSAVATTAPALITFGQTGEIANTQAVPAIAAVDARPQSTFTFTGSGKPGLQLFSGVVTTTSTTSVPFPNVQAPSTSISFFQKSEPVYTSSMQLFTETGPVKSSLSLFNKNETMKTSTVTSSVSSMPVFNFGANTQNTQAEKPKFNFTFGKTSEIPPVFSLPSSNIGLLSGNGLHSGNTAPSNTITGGNGLTTGKQATTEDSNLTSNTLFSKIKNNKLSNTLTSGHIGEPAKDNLMWNNELGAIKMSSENSLQQGINNLPVIQSSNLFSQQQKKENMWPPNQNSTLSHKLLSGNTVDPANNSVGSAQGTMFGTTDKKENMTWSGNNNSNIFVSNTGTNSLQKPEPFYFGSSMQFDPNNVTPVSTFGNPANKPQTQNIFGITTQVNNNQPAMFSSTLQNQTPPNIFGAQTVNNTASTVGMFGTPNAGANHSFGTPTPLQTFEVAPLNPVTPTFNFGAQQTTGVFGFGQQQAQMQGGVYQFGTQAAVPNPQRQFSIGTAGAAPNAINRRPMRRAVRRTTQR